MFKKPTNISSLLLIGAIFFIPIFAWIELYAGNIWNNRLLIPEIVDTPDLHTPKIIDGTYLPPVINHDTVISQDKSPVILTNTVKVAANVTLTLEPGVHIYANEFATLIVDGKLISQGTPTLPILFSSNEQHPDNQHWAGVVINGEATFSHNNISNASPGISCLGSSRVNINDTKITDGSTGIFTTSPNCVITKSRITAIRVGIKAIGTQPIYKDTQITSGKEVEILSSN